MKTEKKVNGTTHMQATYLKDRISHAMRQAGRVIRELGNDKAPANVIAARKLLKEYEAKQYKRQDTLQKAANAWLNKKADATRQTVLFADPQAGLAAVDRFEKEVSAKYPPL